ncbi:hypothetical protein GF369_00340 [Candidatus Peregrinibacteria bacterium]|nr:hypothetical protein [Candidatus Peregrinibacteria bacterium]
MGDVESFGGFESGQGVDAASFEKFKERIKAAAAQIKALKKGEQKQRKKEEKLIKILLKFVKTSKKQDIMVLIARLLERNIPAVFILSIVVLGNEEFFDDTEGAKVLFEGEKLRDESEGKTLAFFDRDRVLPLKVKIKIDAWMKNVLSQALEHPHRLLKTVYDEDEILILPLLQLVSFVLRDYLEKNDQEPEYERLKEFSDFFLNGVMKEVRQKLDKTKELREDS